MCKFLALKWTKKLLTAFSSHKQCVPESAVKEWRNALYPINQTMVQVDGTCLPGKIPCPSKDSQTKGIGVKSVYIPQLYVDSPLKVVLQRSNKYPSVMFTSGYGFDPNVTVDRPDSLMTANVTIQACPKDEINDDISAGDSGAGLRDINANLYGIVRMASCSHMYGRLEESKYLNETLSKDTFKGGVSTKVASYMPFICKVTKSSEKKGCLPEDKKLHNHF
uniref:Uncharacterized protein n=1 Tax=Ditylenchus dipsaci TaxID=166011 RepID=A0A915E9K3_9BILA